MGVCFKGDQDIAHLLLTNEAGFIFCLETEVYRIPRTHRFSASDTKKTPEAAE